MSLITNQTQLGLIDEFASDLEKSLGVKHEKVSFEELWSSHPPVKAGDMSLQEFMKDVSEMTKAMLPMLQLTWAEVCRNSFFHDDYHSLDAFRSDYDKRFGKQPYVSPPVRWQW